MKSIRSTFAIATIALLALTSQVLADPSIEDVFKSTQDQMGGDVDGKKVLAVICAVVGLIIVLAFFSKLKSREASPRSLNHQGKLMKELQKELSLKPAELRQLKSLVDVSPAENPLVLMLCPSLLSAAAREKPEKIDRRAMASLIKRLEIKTPAAAPSSGR